MPAMDDFNDISDYEPDARRAHVLIIDDTLDMDLTKMKLGVDVRNIFEKSGTNVTVEYAQTQKQALRRLKEWQEEGIRADVVLCDYKLQVQGGPEEWGTQILKNINDTPDLRPKKSFLMSKSGFREQDRPLLDAIGAEYCHSYELLYMAAQAAGNEAVKQLHSQVAKTHNLRERFNKTLGTSYSLSEYRSPDIKAVERGNIPVTEVMRRVQKDDITHVEAFDLLDKDSVRRALYSRVDQSGTPGDKRISIGLGVKGPAKVGRLAFSQSDIERIHSEHPGDPVILVLNKEYSPNDNALIGKVSGLVLLDKGTAHIPVLAENHNIPVLFANRNKYKQLTVRGDTLIAHDGLIERGPFAKVGDWVSLDGQTLELFSGRLPVVEPTSQDKKSVRDLADMADNATRLVWHVRGKPDHTGLKTMANADTFEDVKFAKSVPGVRGVGLLRTEHMFLDTERMKLLQDEVFAEESMAKVLRAGKFEGRPKLYEELRKDFLQIFTHAGKDFPIKVRLLDAPPDEFFPHPNDADAIARIAQRIGEPEEKVRQISENIHSKKLRGAAFAMEYPEIYQTQLYAIFDAAQEAGVVPEIMIPLLRNEEELRFFRDMVDEVAAHYSVRRVADKGLPESFVRMPYKFGVMLETAEAVIDYHSNYDGVENATALLKEIAKTCQFVSFGTNDLTSEILGIPRDDMEKIVEWNHTSRNPNNPFETLVPEVSTPIMHTVGVLHEENPKLEIGLCGRQATDRDCVEFCQENRFDSISTAPAEVSLLPGMIEAGRTAMLTSTRERERLLEILRKQLEERKALQEGRLPDSVKVTSENAVKHSPLVFVLADDDHDVRREIIEEFQGLPVVYCDSINDTLRAVTALQSQGKKVRVLTDMNLPLFDSRHIRDLDEDTAWFTHPLLKEVRTHPDREKWGVAFANAIADGKIPGMTAEDVAMVSGGNPSFYNLNPEIKTFDKSSYVFEYLHDHIERAVEAYKPKSAPAKPGAGKIIVYADDEEIWRQFFQVGIRQAFGCKIVVVNDGDQALEELERGHASLLVTDQLMQRMQGTELVDALHKKGRRLSPRGM